MARNIGVKNLIDHPDLFHVRGYVIEGDALPIRGQIFGEVRQDVFRGPWVSFEAHFWGSEDFTQALRAHGFPEADENAQASLDAATL